MTNTQILQALAEGKAVKQIAAQAKVSIPAMQQRINRMCKRGNYVNAMNMVAEWSKGVNIHT